MKDLRINTVKTDQDETFDFISNIITSEVVLALRTGNKKAFEQIYRYFHHSMIQFLNSILQSPDLTEDCCQELFANLWEKRESIDSNKNFRSYLFTTAKNLAIDYLRKQKASDILESNILQIMDSRYSDDFLIAEETRKQILTIIMKMPKQRKKIFVLSRFKLMSNDEISQQLGITKNAVEKHISFALNDIRKQLVLL